MKLNRKLGIVGAIAVLLVGVGAFGFGHSTNVRADVQKDGAGIYILNAHVIEPTSAGVAQYDCSKGGDPNAVVNVFGVLNYGAQPVTQTPSTHLDISNYPAAYGGYTISTSTTIGIPLVMVTNTAGQNNFFYICVNTSPFTTPNAYNTASVGTYCTTGGAAPVCTTQDGDITFSAISPNAGLFDQPACSNVNNDTLVGVWSATGGADNCQNMTGLGTPQLEIPAATNNLNTVIVRFACAGTPFNTGGVFPITINQDQGSFTFNVVCRGEASATGVTISATPNTVEIIPARSNTSHSLILLRITDSFGNPVIAGRDVDFRTDKCSIETAGLGISTPQPFGVLGSLSDPNNVLSYGAAISATSGLNAAAPGTYANWEFSAVAWYPIDPTGGFTPQADLGKTIDGFDLNANGIPDVSYAGAVLSCNPIQAIGVTPGVANITACIQTLNAVDICVATTVKVIGPPASITVAAAPTSVNCGEKSTITATVVDSIGQNVSDHTRVELVTNLGGVLGGTGAVAGFAANVAPISSSVADTFGGVATAFLITSQVTTGPYEVIATSGGTTSGDSGILGSVVVPAFQPLNNLTATPFSIAFSPLNIPFTNTYLGGTFSTPPVSAQVTVICSNPVVAAPVVAAPAPVAPAIVAPRTGTGIQPPNTGDAGLASSSTSGSSWTLFALGGVFALTLAGLATAKFARR